MTKTPTDASFNKTELKGNMEQQYVNHLILKHSTLCNKWRTNQKWPISIKHHFEIQFSYSIIINLIIPTYTNTSNDITKIYKVKVFYLLLGTYIRDDESKTDTNFSYIISNIFAL